MAQMEVEVLDTEIVMPKEKTLEHTLQLNQLDRMSVRAYAPVLYYYRPNKDPSFFSPEILKASLSKVMVPFYPLAGRLVVGDDGGLEIKCTGEGALFVVARCGNTLDELGEVVPSKEALRLLVPSPESEDPPCMVMMLQITFFKCGGVCLASALQHSVADGASAGYIMSAWAEVTRGGEISAVPFFDRSVLCARSPPVVRFDHIDYTYQTNCKENPFDTAVLKLSKNQVCMLKSRFNSTKKVSTFTAVATHLWRSACKARGLAGHQEKRLFTAVNFRNRLVPPLPPGFIGTAVARVSAASTVNELISSSLEIGAARIQDAVARVDDEYLRSLIDFLSQQEKVERFMRGSWVLRREDFWITSWLGLRICELDFGWGEPYFVVRGSLQMAGLMYILPSSSEHGGVTLFVGFELQTMRRFKKILYEDLEERMGGDHGQAAITLPQ